MADIQEHRTDEFGVKIPHHEEGSGPCDYWFYIATVKVTSHHMDEDKHSEKYALFIQDLKQFIKEWEPA